MLDKNVTSLEWSKKLKAAGFQQEGEFWWFVIRIKWESSNPTPNEILSYKLFQLPDYFKDEDLKKLWWYYSPVAEFHSNKPTKEDLREYPNQIFIAPLATELLEKLPIGCSIHKTFQPDSVKWVCSQNEFQMKPQKFFYSNNPCDALAEMWIYLKEYKEVGNEEESYNRMDL